MTYHGDMPATESDLVELLAQVTDATNALKVSREIPAQVGGVIDSFESVLGAATPLKLEADPYLTTTLWAAAFRAEKALRHDNSDQQRRDVRIALEQVRHALRDIVENRPFDEGSSVHDVLTRVAKSIGAPQKSLAELFDVSVRQLQRWLAEDGSRPSAEDEARIRVVGRVVNQLRHTFTGPGVVAWFERQHPSLGERPVDMLKDPVNYPRVLSAATASRAMTV